MPIYEYVCSACGHRTDILHGIHEPGPHFCPECGTEGSMRKAFAPPTIVFKGSGWAKKERRSSGSSGSRSKGDRASGDGDGDRPSKGSSDTAGSGSGSSGSTSGSGSGSDD